jgi:hypothetical protein
MEPMPANRFGGRVVLLLDTCGLALEALEDDPQPGVNVLVDAEAGVIRASKHASIQDLLEACGALVPEPGRSRFVPVVGEVD